MCRMRRLLVNCLLLVSLVSAVPDGRHKRDLSYFKNLVTSTLFGRSAIHTPRVTHVQTEPKYKLYRVPGFNDVLIKADVPKEAIVKENEVLDIKPFESYVGTRNVHDTAEVFVNVNNLLSTGLLNRQQNNLMRKTMTPIFADLNSRNLNRENLKTVSVFPKTLPSVITNVIKPAQGTMFSGQNEVKIVAEEIIKHVPVIPKSIQPMVAEVEIKVPFKTKYSYTQLVNNEPAMIYSTPDNSEVLIEQRLEAISTLPRCIKQRVHEAVSLGASPHHKVPINGGIVINSLKTTSSQYSNVFNHQLASSRSTTSNTGQLKYTEHDSSASATKYIPLNPFPYLLPNLVKEEIIIDTIEGPQKIQSLPTSSITILEESAPEIRVSKSKSVNRPINKPVSSGSNKQTSHDSTSKYRVVKEKDEVNTPSARHNDVPHSTTSPKAVPKQNNLNIVQEEKDEAKTTEPPNLYISPFHSNLKNMNKSTRVKTGGSVVISKNTDLKKDKIKKNETLSQYINEEVSRNKPRAFSIVEEKDTVSPNLNNYANRPKGGVDIEKYIKNLPTHETLSRYIYREISQDNPNMFSMVKEGDELKTNVVTDSTLLKHNAINSPLAGKADGVTVGKQNSFKDNPIVVDDTNYSYHQSNPDGGSTNVTGNKNGVSVSINGYSSKGRGDIPEK